MSRPHLFWLAMTFGGTLASGSTNGADRMRLTRLVAGRGAMLLLRCARAPLRAMSAFSTPAPERLLIAPQDIRTTDPTIAADIYSGYFVFAGKAVNTHGASPFDLEAPSPGWSVGLAGFSWLRHLRAADTALARANARALIGDWLNARGRAHDKIDWHAGVAARRLLSWLAQSPLILDGADRVFYRRFMRALGQHAKHLQRCMADGLEGEARLLCTIALAELGLCAQGMPKLARRGTKLLVDELSAQILVDGGHIGRNPQMIVDLLLDLLPLRQAYAARGASAPQMLLNVIDRMMPMLRLFRHGDGSMALFNGMGPTAAHALATVLAYDDARAMPLMHAPNSGYERLEAGETILVADVGAPPPAAFSCDAHAGALSFEMSSAGQRVIVNCGVPYNSRPALREAARSTAAHSTLVVNDVSSCRFATGAGLDRWVAGQVIAGPKKVDARRLEDVNALKIEATHDGYDQRFGILHHRRLTLASDGRRIEGEDRLPPTARRVPGAGQAEYAVRFHLHPMVRAEILEDGGAIHLSLADGQEWLFRANGLQVGLEESIFLGGREGPRNTTQIVIAARVRDYPAIIWTVERLG
ncbi:MAG: Heparinase family protein [Hyphomicrobiales bacterium]|nr:Heparinase family protein [Hyphomicrobiales bacterium]